MSVINNDQCNKVTTKVLVYLMNDLSFGNLASGFIYLSLSVSHQWLFFIYITASKWQKNDQRM